MAYQELRTGIPEPRNYPATSAVAPPKGQALDEIGKRLDECLKRLSSYNQQFSLAQERLFGPMPDVDREIEKNGLPGGALNRLNEQVQALWSLLDRTGGYADRLLEV